MRNEALVIGITRPGQPGHQKQRHASAGFSADFSRPPPRAIVAREPARARSRTLILSLLLSPAAGECGLSPSSLRRSRSVSIYPRIPVGNRRDFGDHATPTHFAGPSAAVALAIRHHRPSLVARIRARPRAGAPSLALTHVEFGLGGRARRLLADSGSSQYNRLLADFFF